PFERTAEGTDDGGPILALCNLEIVQKTHERKASVDGMEEGPVLVVRPPIGPRGRHQAATKGTRSSVGGLPIFGLLRCPKKLGRGQERAVVIEDVLAPVVDDLAVMRR